MILDNLFSKRSSLENPSTSLADPDAWLYHAMGSTPTIANVTVNERNANSITAFWSAVGTISDTLGVLPFRLVRKLDNGGQEIVRDHPAYLRMAHSPNDFMTAVVFKSTMQAHALTWGNGYVWIRRNAMYEPKQLLPLSPNLTKPIMQRGVLKYATQLEDGPATLDADEVLHIPALSRNGMEGMSVVREQREMLGASLAAQQFAARLFANGAKPGGLLSFPNKIRDPDKLRNEVQKKYSGENAHGLLVTDGGAKYQPFGIPPDDAQFLQTREFSIDEVGRMFRLPLHFLNKMGQATFSNLEAMGAHFVQYTMMPWITRWEQEVTRKLLSEADIAGGLVFKINASALMRGDVKTRSELYTKGITNGWMTRNEVRLLEDMNPLDGLDDPLVPLNMGTLDDDEPDETDDTDDDEPDESDDETNARRSAIIVRAAVERLVNKEIVAVRRMFASSQGAALGERLQSFYTKHRAHLVANLAIDEQQARSYCTARGAEVLDAAGLDELNSRLRTWATDNIETLVAITDGESR